MIRSLALSDPILGVWSAFSVAESALVRLGTVAGLPVSTGLQAAAALRWNRLLPEELYSTFSGLMSTRNQVHHAVLREGPPPPDFVTRYIDTAFKLADLILELEPDVTDKAAAAPQPV